MDDDVEAVTEADHAPVFVHDSEGFPGTAGSIPGPIILHSSAHIVEGLAAVGIDLVELSYHEVVDIVPVLSAVVGDTYAAILSLPHPAGILWVDPEAVIINMSVG